MARGRTFNRFSNQHTAVQKNYLSLLMRFFFFCLLVAGIYFIALNVTPYIKISALLAEAVLGKNTNSGIFGKATIGIFGFIFWAILQIVEIMPALFMSNENFLKKLIDKTMNRTKYKVQDDDEKTLADAKVSYNRLPTTFLRNLRKACLFAYVGDFFINAIANPPIIGGFQLLGNMLMYGRIELIDWGNVAINIQTVIAFEAIILGIIWTQRLLTSINER
jgi:hypothetical protein